MKYNIYKNLMDKIDTEEKAYWLGFFYADAYNNEKCGRVVVELQEQDEKHLVKCAHFFGQPRKPFKQLKNGGKYIAYRLELNSKHLTKSLASLGCHQTKSFSITFPAWMPKNLIRHFVRGYFDGDGCIYTHQDQLGVLIVSTKEMLESIAFLLAKIGVKGHISHPEKYTNNTYRLDFGGSRQVKKFCDWIYKDAEIYLDRKYDLFKSYCEKHKFRFST
jgi:intein/homing endonuclease